MIDERMKPRPRSLWRLTHVVICFLILPSGVSGQNKLDWDNLMTELTTGYNRDIRPVNDWDSVTYVYLGVQLLSLDVNEGGQTIKTSISLDIEWDDSYLSWNTTTYGGIEAVMLRQSSLWLPDIVVSNTVTSQAQLGYKDLQLRVQSDGEIWWSPSSLFETSCDIDITYYPFDTQVCSIIFKTAVSTNQEINVFIDQTNPMDLAEYSDNGLWELTNSSARNLGADKDGNITVTKIQYSLQLKRRREYYVTNIILPIIFMSLISSATFALPSEAREKMSLAITILLTYAVYLTIITGSMPATSTQVSVMTVYLELQLALTAACVIFNIIVLQMHHRGRPFTGCFASLIVGLRRVMCMYPHPDQDVDDGEEGTLEDEMNDDRDGGVELERISTVTNSKITRCLPAKTNRVFPTSERKVVFPSGKKGGRKVGSQCVSDTLDRFLLIVFTTISISSTVAFVIVLTTGGETQFSAASLE